MLNFQNRKLTINDANNSLFSSVTINYLIQENNNLLKQYKPLGALLKFCPNGLYGAVGLPYKSYTDASIWLLDNVYSFSIHNRKQNEDCLVYYPGNSCLAFIVFKDDLVALEKVITSIT